LRHARNDRVSDVLLNAAVRHARNDRVSDVLLNAAVQNVQQAQLQNIPMMFNDISSTQKYLIS